MFIVNRLLFATTLMLFSATAWSQEFRSTLAGRITDSQGLVIPHAKVVVTQSDTGTKYETVTGTEGQYTAPFLQPGLYTVTAEASGFKRYVRQGLQISTNERMSLDIQLQIGELTDSVSVSGDAPQLEGSTASVGQVIISRQLESMPMAGRTPLVLAQLSFGVLPTATNPQYMRPMDNQGPSDFSMGGAPMRANELLLDGAPNMSGNAWKVSAAAGARVAYNPPLDAVAELKVESFQVDAAYGHTGGGTVNVVMRGGTNTVHGTMYEYNQVSRLAASPFFTNAANQKKLVTRYNQWGVGGGGPIYLPRVFNGRDKVFFYFIYEGIHDSIPGSGSSTVPTALERKGDFSDLLKVGANYQIYNPYSGVVAGSRVQRQPFPGNKIPLTLNPVALAYLQFYPAPNVPGDPDGGNNYVSPTNGEIRRFASTLGRMDFNLGTRNKLFLNSRMNDGPATRCNSLGQATDSITACNGTNRQNWGALIDHVFTLSPTMLLNTRVNWARFEEPRPNFSYGFDATTLGFPKYMLTNSNYHLLPSVSPSSFTGIGQDGGVKLISDSFQIFSTLSKIIGIHSLKTGVDLRQYRETAYVYGLSSGSFSFSTNWTRGPLDNSSGAPRGQDFAAFLLGLPTSGSFDVNGASMINARYYALFLQDDIRLKSNLTFNVGVRYERDLATTERYDRTAIGFDFGVANPISAAASAAYAKAPIPEIAASQFKTPGGLVFATPSHRNPYDTRGNYFSPRVGVAWTPSVLGAKTVIRAGLGVFIFPIGAVGIEQYGYSQQTTLVATNDGYLTPAMSLSDPFPGGIQSPTGSSLGLSTYVGNSVNFFNPHPLNPYAVRWNFDIERQLARNLVIELGYEGNHGVHMTMNRQLDYVPAAYLSTSPFRDQTTIDRLTANVTNPFAGLIPGSTLNGSTIQRQQLLLPLPEFTGVTEEYSNEGRSYYQMFQAKIEKRFSSGLSLLANYSRSKLLERLAYLNNSDLVPEKRIAAEDRPQRIVVSGTYTLPFGKGRVLAKNAKGVLNAVIGGWEINCIYQIQPGPPLSWGNVIYLGGDLNMDPRNPAQAFDLSLFNRNSAQQLANNIRNFPSRFANLRSDGTNNMDASVIKGFSIRENLKLQYRFETFNTTNHVMFSAPSTSPTSSGFGKITSQANLQRRTQMALKLVW
jgi:hypothetical protein